MKKKSASQSAPARRSLGEGGFFKLRVLLAFVFCLTGALIALGDPYNGLSFWHTNEYSQYSAPQRWHTPVGKFQFGNPSTLGNISARAFVQTGDNATIGGFMVQGTEPKRVIIRAIGPELTQYGVPNALANPTLELHDGTGALIASNNNWVSTIIGGIIASNQVNEIQASGYAPGDPFESAIIADLPAGNYTAIVRGVNNMTGVALVEAYDLDSRSSHPTYDAAIQEGRTAAQELINQGASAVAIALVDDKRIIWSQGFGLADRDTGQAATNTT